MSRFYGFSEDWRRRVDVAFPAVLGDTTPSSSVIRRDTDLVFATKVQKIKRPDLFVDGVTRFMTHFPTFTGRAIFACRMPQTANCLAAVPQSLIHRFVQVEEGRRQAVIAGNIVVIPSAYESLCLTAYEAAAAGATLVLNATCPAFGSRTPWAEPEAAYCFDGTAGGPGDGAGSRMAHATSARPEVDSRPSLLG